MNNWKSNKFLHVNGNPKNIQLLKILESWHLIYRNKECWPVKCWYGHGQWGGWGDVFVAMKCFDLIFFTTKKGYDM